jgi:muconolactone delta-isomerase
MRQDSAVAAECRRANEGLQWLGKEGEVILVTGSKGRVVEQPMCLATLAHLSTALGVASSSNTVDELASSSEAMSMSQQQIKQGIMQRMWRQVRALENCTAAAVTQSEQRRNNTTWAPLAQQLSRAATEKPSAVAAPLIESNRCVADE